MHPSSLFEANRCFSLHIPTGESHTDRWKISPEITACCSYFVFFFIETLKEQRGIIQLLHVHSVQQKQFKGDHLQALLAVCRSED